MPRQAIIENPVINSPFDEPQRHFHFDDEGISPIGADPPGDTLVRTIHYGYDDLYRLTREHVTENDGSGPVTTLNVRYTYDKVGNRLAMVRDERSGEAVYRHTTTYAYDDNDRLTGSTTVTDAGNLAAQNNLDRHYAGRPRPWTRWFALSFIGLTLAAFWVPLLIPSRKRGRKPSRAGNQSRACKQADGGNAPPPLGHRARRKRLFTACVATFLTPLMAVDPATLHAGITEAIQAQMALSAGVPLSCPVDTVCTTYAYDDNGNQVSRSRTNAQGTATDTYTFDYQNRLAGAITNIDTAPTHVAYEYDADGIRVAKTVSGSRVRHVVDKNQAYAQVVEERAPDTGEVIVRYTYGDDLISQHRPESTGTRYYHYDGQMSTRALTNSETETLTEITDTYAYCAYGQVLLHTGPTNNTYLYSGEQLDEAIGEYYLRARYYTSAIGRFISSDPLASRPGNPTSLHKYLYAHNNPITLVDPSGLFVDFTLGGLAIAVLFGLDLAYNLAVSPNNLARSLGLVNSASNPLAASINKFFTSVGDKLAIFGGFMRGMAEGAAQGFFNIVNGVQDQIIGLANLAIKAALISLGPAGLQFDISIPSPDWSYGLIFDEPRTQHGVSKFLGGLGVSLLLTGLLGLTGAGGSAATLNAGELQLSRTVAGHAATRPYVNSRLLVQEIINSKPPIPDPGGIPGGLRWDVFGAFNGSQGLFELVVDPATKTIVHFLFKSV